LLVAIALIVRDGTSGTKPLACDSRAIRMNMC